MPTILVVGSPSQSFCRRRLTSGTVSIGQLRRRAKAHGGVRSAVEFITTEVRPSPKRQQRWGNFVDGKLTFGQLIDFAVEWDSDGLTEVSDFLDALECEASGSARSNAVCREMSDLGIEAAYHRKLDEYVA